MTDWPADARAFSCPTSKAREKRPGVEVELIFTCVYAHVNFTGVNEIEATYEVFLLNVKRDSTFTFTRDLSYTVPVPLLFVSVNFAHVLLLEFRDCGNQPLGEWITFFKCQYYLLLSIPCSMSLQSF